MNRAYIPYILVGLMLFAFVFSVFFVLPQSLGLDEAQSMWQAEHSVTGLFYVVGQDVHVPLYHLILHFWLIFWGNSVKAARVLSLIFYLITIPLVYYLGKLAFRESLALFATALFVLSPFTNWYGSNIRMYSLLALWTVVNQIFFLLIVKGKPERHKLHWLGYFFSALLGMYTHYFFAFVLATEGIYYVVYRKIFPKGSFRNFLTIAIILVALFIPWLYYVHVLGGLGANTTPKLAPPSTVNVFNTFTNFLFGFQTDLLNTVILSAWPFLTLLLLFALQKNKKVGADAVFFMAIVILPIIAAAALSHIMEPFFLSRYFIGVLPSFCIAVAWFLSLYPRSASAFAKTALAAAMVVALQLQTASPMSSIKEDYSGVAAYVSANASSRDVVALSTPFTVYPFEYYYSGDASLTTLPIWNRLKSGAIPDFTAGTLSTDLATFKNYDELWLVLSYDQGYEQQLRIYMDTHYQRIYEEMFSPDLTLYVYKLGYHDVTLSDAEKLAQSTPGANTSSGPELINATSTNVVASLDAASTTGGATGTIPFPH